MTNPRATTRSTGSAPSAPPPIARPSPSGRRPTACPREGGGMVERVNRRRAEHLGRRPQNRAAHHRRFRDHAKRDACLHTFVADDNRTRLRCLGYNAPAELLANLAGHNTKAGAGLYGATVVKPHGLGGQRQAWVGRSRIDDPRGARHWLAAQHVNAGEKTHWLAGVKMHHGGNQAGPWRTLLSSSID